jgi:hypothetical protein
MVDVICIPWFGFSVSLVLVDWLRRDPFSNLQFCVGHSQTILPFSDMYCLIDEFLPLTVKIKIANPPPYLFCASRGF